MRTEKYYAFKEQTLDLVVSESLRDTGRLDSSEPTPPAPLEPPLKEVAPLHESGVVGLPLWPSFFGLLLIETDFDLR